MGGIHVRPEAQENLTQMIFVGLAIILPMGKGSQWIWYRAKETDIRQWRRKKPFDRNSNFGTTAPFDMTTLVAIPHMYEN
jgi:hypothetical protein